nr:ABC transporter ATP-binding protein [uncultured Treponema sp.]
MSDVVIRAENLSKYYNLGVINNGTLFRDIQTWWALKRGKEDPHSQIGSHKYDTTKEGFWALKDLNFEIKQGDRVGIIGKNGAGKSTLLKILSRITAPTEGKVKIKGRVASLLEVGTGFHAELTGRENIYLNGAILGMKRKEVDRKLDEIIAFSEIENHIDTPVKRYSSGMYVRLAFAVAAHLDSEILIADEVLAVGDAAFQKKALGKMNDLSSGQGRTVLFVSHNMSQVKKLCNKGIILDHGTLLRQDDDINKSIAYYLGTDNEGHNEVTTVWKNNDNFTDDCFTPVEMKIVDHNDKTITKVLDNKKKYFIKLVATVKQPSSITNFGISIYSNTEVIVISKPFDTKLHCGANTFLCELPENFLSPGDYSIVLGATEKSTRWILNPNDRHVFINIKVKGDYLLQWKKL